MISKYQKISITLKGIAYVHAMKYFEKGGRFCLYSSFIVIKIYGAVFYFSWWPWRRKILQFERLRFLEGRKL